MQCRCSYCKLCFHRKLTHHHLHPSILVKTYALNPPHSTAPEPKPGPATTPRLVCQLLCIAVGYGGKNQRGLLGTCACPSP